MQLKESFSESKQACASFNSDVTYQYRRYYADTAATSQI